MISLKTELEKECARFLPKKKYLTVPENISVHMIMVIGRILHNYMAKE